MGAKNSANGHREMIELIEREVRRFEAATKDMSSVARGEIEACKDFCRAAKDALEKSELEGARAKILQAGYYQRSAEVHQKEHEKIKADIETALSEARREVLEEHYPKLARRGSQSDS